MSEAAVPAPKKGKPIVLVLLAAVVAGGGAAAFFVLEGAPAGEAPAAGAPTSDGEGAGKTTAASLHGPIAEFPSIIVNLNEPEGTRYLKATVAISLADERVVAEVERLKPVIRDQFIRELSELNFRQTMGAKNKLAVKRRLLKRFNDLLGPDAGTDVFLTEFIVQ